MEREINARQALKDILGGMGDPALMDKYKLSFEGLQRLFQSLIDAGLLVEDGDGFAAPPKKKVVARQIVEDIRSGVTDEKLKEKYRMSSLELQMTFRLLIDGKHITAAELQNRPRSQESSIGPFIIRELPRYRSQLRVTARADEAPETEGHVLDISEKGMRAAGIEAKVGLIHTLTILGDDMGEVAPFEFEALCRWTRRAPDGELLAGFEIVNISDDSFDELLNWIRICTK